MLFKITQKKFEQIVLGLSSVTLYCTCQYLAIKFFLIEAPLSFATISFSLFLAILFLGLFIGSLEELDIVKFKEEK